MRISMAKLSNILPFALATTRPEIKMRYGQILVRFKGSKWVQKRVLMCVCVCGSM